MGHGPVICVGDHTVDVYVDDAMAYPGGNTVNVAVGLAQQGITTHWMGQVGSDHWGRWLLAEVAGGGVHTTSARTVTGATSWTEVRLVDGEREYPAWDDGVAHVRLDHRQLQELGTASLVHTGEGSGVEDQLAAIRSRVNLLSFDFSDRPASYVAEFAPLADIAVWSAPDLSVTQALTLLLDSGCRLAAVTMGAGGALVADRREQRHQSPVGPPALDTLGAGDAFIAGMLAGFLAGDGVADLARRASVMAAAACARRGAFGSPVPVGPVAVAAATAAGRTWQPLGDEDRRAVTT